MSDGIDLRSIGAGRTAKATIMKATNEQIIAAYEKHGSVHKAGKALGMNGSSVHERLVKIGKNVSPEPEFNEEQMAMIRELYLSGFKTGDNRLNDLAESIGKSKQNVCRWARRNGLTNKHRSLDSRQVEEMKEHIRVLFTEKGHPRGALGMRHSEEAKAAIGRKASVAWKAMSPDARAAKTMKMLKTKAERGNSVNERQKTTWKGAWREIGGVRKYYRSAWEANYARYLQFLKDQKQIAKWEHEPETFWFENIKRGCRSYLPDFKVTRNDGTVYYVEVKGWMDDRSKTKIKRMAIYHRTVELQVVDSKIYRALAKTASRIIKEWE